MKSPSGMYRENVSPHVRDQAIFDCGQQLGGGWALPGFPALDTLDENHPVYLGQERPSEKRLLRKDTSFTSVAKRTDMKMVLVFLFTRTP